MAGGFHSLSAAFGRQAVRARLAQGLAHGVQADHGFSRHGRARRGLERVAVNQLEFQGDGAAFRVVAAPWLRFPMAGPRTGCRPSAA